MVQLQALLNYQEIDGKLYKMEREFASCDEKKEYGKVKKFLETAPEKLDALEAKASALQAEAAAIAKKYEQVEGTLDDFEHLEELVGGGADIAFYKKKAQSIVEQLKKLKADLNVLTANIKATDAEYQKLKKQVIAAEKQAPEVIKKYKLAKTAFDKEKAGVEAELSKIAENISPELLTKYNTKRKEKIFPIIGELYSGRCPFCSMEPPLVAKSKLADGIECDNCHRIIFEKK